MSFVCVAFFVLSTLYAALSGRTALLTAAITGGASAGFTLAISLAGPLCLWSGLQAVMEASGLSRRLSRLLQPLLRRLFPQAYADPVAAQALCANFSANLLGLGNAATPPGIAAVQRMRQLSGQADASDEMCRFIILNTASIQLFPMTVAAVRSSFGAAAPMDILPAVWLTSFCALAVGLIAARILARWFQ